MRHELTDMPVEWRAQALCAQTDPEVFFPEKGGSARAALGVCSRCAVRAECLNFALENGERFGVWGGISERKRNRMRRDLGDAELVAGLDRDGAAARVERAA